jgi:hypothetical protein
MLTIVLFAIGGLIATIAVYQELTMEQKPYRISHDDALKIALVQVDKEQYRDAASYPNQEAAGKLIHVTDVGVGYIVDEISHTDMMPYSNQKFRSVFENTYLWLVYVRTFNDVEESIEYAYLIDTSNGKIVGDSRNEPYETS